MIEPISNKTAKAFNKLEAENKRRNNEANDLFNDNQKLREALKWIGELDCRRDVRRVVRKALKRSPNVPKDAL